MHTFEFEMSYEPLDMLVLSNAEAIFKQRLKYLTVSKRTPEDTWISICLTLFTQVLSQAVKNQMKCGIMWYFTWNCTISLQKNQGQKYISFRQQSK